MDLPDCFYNVGSAIIGSFGCQLQRVDCVELRNREAFNEELFEEQRVPYDLEVAYRSHMKPLVVSFEY